MCLTKHTYIEPLPEFLPHGEVFGVLSPFFPGKETSLQLYYQLKIWTVSVSASYIKENKEQRLPNQQKHSGFWCKGGFYHPDLTHSITPENKEALVPRQSEAYSFTSASQMSILVVTVALSVPNTCLYFRTKLIIWLWPQFSRALKYL